ncbi:unnamed protein product [Arctogadus glacialis]
MRAEKDPFDPPVQRQFSESEARARTGPSDSTSLPAHPTICLYSNELLIRVLLHVCPLHSLALRPCGYVTQWLCGPWFCDPVAM